METSHRPKQAKSIPEGRKVQNGDPRINADIRKCRGIGDISRPPGCLSPYPNSPKVLKVYEISGSSGINPQDKEPVCPDCKTFDVTRWVVSIN